MRAIHIMQLSNAPKNKIESGCIGCNPSLNHQIKKLDNLFKIPIPAMALNHEIAARMTSSSCITSLEVKPLDYFGSGASRVGIAVFFYKTMFCQKMMTCSIRSNINDSSFSPSTSNGTNGRTRIIRVEVSELASEIEHLVVGLRRGGESEKHGGLVEEGQGLEEGDAMADDAFLEDVASDGGENEQQRSISTTTRRELGVDSYIRVPSVPMVSDTIKWNGDLSGCYSIALSFKSLLNLDHSLNGCVYKVLWKLQIPENVKFFPWQGIIDSLSTNSKRFSGRLADSEACVQCFHIKEYILHVVRDYPHSREVWLIIGPKPNFMFTILEGLVWFRTMVLHLDVA
ncbi:hypothetical protein Fmac_015960 [Flemingia macrophylla]|uniref:Reverse transcriptase zinc-binding domain-containing protein n=1 Tax=Flemingia macrophylla TaxID=520843 RepID=A0ABD1MG46_9FABA